MRRFSPHSRVSAKNFEHVRWRNLIMAGALLLLLYVALPQLGSFSRSLGLVQGADGLWLTTALLCAAATYFVAAAIYVVLAQKPLRYGRTVIVQLSGMFVNRLLPAGLGAIGVSYDYLRKNRHSRPQAAAVVAVNNTLGLSGHLFLLVLAFGLTGVRIIPFRFTGVRPLIVGMIVAAAALVIVLGLRGVRRWVHRGLGKIIGSLAGYRSDSRRVVLAFGLSTVLTSLYVLSLWSCLRAVGIDIGVVESLVVLTLGVAGATVTPTPGGLGGAEAGIVAGVVAYGSSGAAALAGALLYRLLTYWLPLLSGWIAFTIAERRRYL